MDEQNISLLSFSEMGHRSKAVWNVWKFSELSENLGYSCFQTNTLAAKIVETPSIFLENDYKNIVSNVYKQSWNVK